MPTAFFRGASQPHKAVAKRVIAFSATMRNSRAGVAPLATSEI